ncbi:hypothetical protein NECAME_16796 [Necator americanus]|uniref:ABC-type glutathione-S-conjugate transporter n=1 Tax=Necator americanus TaxID=51031 RepID=W2TWI3_NECAM|nr:hypothetical protein NECAME_16796 [Necator americanus]ETN85367.1 hypothetical protein NECAME_16796 [Necator americanus]
MREQLQCHNKGGEKCSGVWKIIKHSTIFPTRAFSQFQTFSGEWRNTSLHSIPHVTECAQHVDFSWLPAIFLIIFCPLTLYDLYHSEHAKASCHSPVTYRILICVVLVIDLSCSLFHNAYSYLILDRKDTLHYLIGDCAQYIGLCLALTLLIACRNRGIVTSGVLFNYWLLTVICGLPELRFLIEHHYSKHVCPELSASFLNQITFTWFTGLAVKGYKKPLERDDLWDLDERDCAKNLIPQFYKYFTPELQKHQDVLKQRQSSEDSSTRQPSVLMPLFKTYKLSFISGALLKLIFDLLHFVAPVLLKLLINFIQDRNQPMWLGIAIASFMFVVAVFQSMILHQYFHLMFRLGMNIRSVLTSAVYSKASDVFVQQRTKESYNRRNSQSYVSGYSKASGHDDICNVILVSSSSGVFLAIPILLSVIFLWRILGVAVIAGLAILVTMVPLNSYISVKMRECHIKQMKQKDERMKLMSEVLNGIKVLKLYSWEKSMENTVLNIRQREINVLKKLAFLNAATTLSWACAPFLVAVLSFAVFVTIDPTNNVLTPQVTFVALALFNILRFPLAIFAMIFSQAVQCRVSNKRLSAFFAEEEMDSSAIGSKWSEEAVRIDGGAFTWDSGGSDETLKNINVSVKRGQLVAIVGKVGSGKSSLLQSILGEMNKVSGRVNVSGSIAYVPQQAWIQNLTLRDNILFNRSYDRMLYEKVIDACAIRQDLASLPAEDLTEIGEKGINLSGGQKQRVSLARAVYSHAEIVLLDDPLSAVDSHVGKHIFENVISSTTGMLSNTTRILVTHGLNYLKYCDKVVVMKDGEINEMGTYHELIAKQGAFSEFLEEFLVEETKKRGRSVSFGESAEDVSEILQEVEEISPAQRKRIDAHMSQEIIIDKTPPADLPSAARNGNAIIGTNSKEECTFTDAKVEEKVALLGAENKQLQKSKLVEKEGVETGKVRWSVYLAYIHAIGLTVALLFIFVYILSSILGVASNLWLAKWSDDAELIQQKSNGSSYETNIRLAIYASLGVGQALFVCAASIIMALGMVGASRILHEGILRNILHSPMLFFDTTPIGRILNRFGKFNKLKSRITKQDVDTVDMELPEAVGELTLTGTDIAVTVFLLIFTTPWVFGPLVVIFTFNATVLDVEAIDTTLPGSIRSMIMTAFNVVATILVIVIATPVTAIPFAFLAVLYIVVLVCSQLTGV